MSVPMMLEADFMLFGDGEDKLKAYLCKHFNLQLKNYSAKQTTISGSCID